jgi:hypothetical protein
MSCSAQEIVDAIIDVGVRRGDDGCGKSALDGYMFMLARTSCRRFGRLFGWALRWMMKAGRDKDRPDFLTREEAEAKLRASGLPEWLCDYYRYIDVRDLPAEQRKRAQPNGTRAITEAVINAAIRRGGDGRGKGGLGGYLLMLERIEPQTFDMMMRMAQRWQVKHPPRSPEPDKREPDPGVVQALAKLKESRELDNKDWGEKPYPYPYEEDPYPYPYEEDPYPDPEKEED